MSSSWLGDESKRMGGSGAYSSNVRYDASKHKENKRYMMEEMMSLLGISKDDLHEKDKDWIKSKIREHKLKIINS